MDPQAKAAGNSWTNVLAYRLKRRDWIIIGWNLLMVGLFDWGRTARPVVALVGPAFLVLTLLATGDLGKSNRRRLLWVVVGISIAWYLVARYIQH
jgi:hypothetical protein